LAGESDKIILDLSEKVDPVTEEVVDQEVDILPGKTTVIETE